MWINFIALFLGLAVLVWSSDVFVSGTSSIAKGYGVSPLLIGLTIVGLGTSAPEILVSAFASIQGNAGLAIGNAIGSNIANIALILGFTALLSPIAFHSDLLKTELPILLAASVFCYVLGLVDGAHGVLDGALMLLGFFGFLFWLIKSAQQAKNNDELKKEIADEIPEMLPLPKAWGFFIAGLVGLLLSSRVLVWGAVNIAESFGVSDLVIGLTIVALGTSLPELATSVASVIKKEDDLAIGNVIGSNMYNLLAVYSLPGLLAPGVLDSTVLDRDFPVMLGLTAVLFILGRGVNNSGSINRIEGVALLIVYFVYQWGVYDNATSIA